MVSLGSAGRVRLDKFVPLSGITSTDPSGAGGSFSTMIAGPSPDVLLRAGAISSATSL